MPRYFSKQTNKEKTRRTENEAREEKVDPAHDDGLGDDIHHVLLHAVHHGLDIGGILHDVSSGLVSCIGLLQVGTLLKSFRKKGLAAVEGVFGDVDSVCAEKAAALKCLTNMDMEGKRMESKQVSIEGLVKGLFELKG